MAQINKPTDYFNTLLYTATGVQSVTGAGFQPDMSWVKARSTTSSHYIADAVRGSTKTIKPNATDAEGTIDLITSFDSDGVTLGSANWSDSRTAVIWNWLAGGTASSNTDGSITTQVSANTAAGFSIVTYTGNGTAGATIGHGLNQAPEAFISKVRNQANQWHCGFAPLGWTNQIHIDTSGAATSSTIFNNTAPDSSVVTLGSSSGTNWSGNTFVAYCFHSVKGYSKIGSYTGNGSADGPFIYTGFKPAFTIIKNASASYDWLAQDSTRQADANFDGNPVNILNQVNASNAESNASTRSVDYLSNGFKIRQNTAAWNTSGNTFIYMAFAENPLVGTNNIPSTAR